MKPDTNGVMIQFDELRLITNGLKQLAKLEDAFESARKPADSEQLDAGFASTAREVARRLTAIGHRLATVPAAHLRVLRRFVAEDAAKALTPSIYRSNAEFRDIAAALILPRIDAALIRQA